MTSDATVNRMLRSYPHQLLVYVSLTTFHKAIYCSRQNVKTNEVPAASYESREERDLQNCDMML